MKLSTVVALLSLGSANAFVVAPSAGARSTELSAVDRRQFAQVAFTVGAATFLGGAPALASPRGGDYIAKFADLKMIAGLGGSLDNLVKRFEDEATVEAGLENVRVFNRDPSFYTGYAKNFISKSVTNNAEGDVRLGYVRQACTLIASTQPLLEGQLGMVGEEAQKEAVKRIKKAQGLIGKFLTESGVEGSSEIAEYVKAHPVM
mmetsp:Transcript_8842/g.14706  ORF Transcript_8842/g.14706 Transcript_8842/m.14706 type:complete len:204 (+) Transcript_8842:36-647(+)|eukprot:CAMPEP_0119013286 /NCGR_PEP_ID=MMETSP1176-20130426/8314_1 /TAXON_ID=265551 /ORGANISM="Synedropsis recta cf, Strain CCMP1620" /LENGTH=203 /DNA_ID=CAMNT_0006966367 /DNA_START=34 /DNA_END=645 /DNA_ORIENTATION=+